MRISGFILPFGGKLSADNRCLNLAGMMPWEMVEEIYAGKFKNERADGKNRSSICYARRACPARAFSPVFRAAPDSPFSWLISEKVEMAGVSIGSMSLTCFMDTGLNQDGMEYTADNINALRGGRHHSKKIRNAGGHL